MEEGYFDDDLYNSWELSNKDLILEEYIDYLSDEDELSDFEIMHITFENVPQEFKDNLFQKWNENGGDESIDL